MKKTKLINYVTSLFIIGTISCSLLINDSKTVNADNDNIETKLFRRIEAADGVNNLEKVKDDIKRVLKLNPKHAGATFYAGKYCFQQGNFENAQKFLKRVAFDPVYGTKANNILADMRIKKYNSKFLDTLKVYLNGESFAQALEICEEALVDMPDNHELLFSAAYAACMLDKKTKADTYAELYATQTGNSPLSAELKTLVDAWFTENFDNDLAIEKFLSLKSKSLYTAPVKRRIRKILVENKSIERYEDFINKEMQQPTADKDSLERELITFLLEQHQFKKALELLNNRPIDSIEDNLLYIWALCEDNQDLKAINTAKALMNAAPRDLRVYKAWVEAWLSYTDKNKNTPEGRDDTGTPYDATIKRLFELLRPDKLVKQEPELLIDLLRLASFTNNSIESQKLSTEVAKIAFEDSHEKLLLKTCDELVAFDRGRMAVNILESAVNQLPENYNLALKLAQLYMMTNPAASVRLCEEVMQQQPQLVRAFIMWCDAMNLAGRGGEAVSELVNRLSDESLNEIVRRQLNSKLETLRMQGNKDIPYEGPAQREIGRTYSAENGGSEEDEMNTEDNNGLEEETNTEEDTSYVEDSASEDETPDGSSSNSDINSYSPPKTLEDNEEFDY